MFWLGNIAEQNPKGNRPRFPFQIAEVDRDSGLLLRDSIRIVDDRSQEEPDLLTLSNFYAREDRQTKNIALHMTRLFPLEKGWKGDAYLYQIPV